MTVHPTGRTSVPPAVKLLLTSVMLLNTGSYMIVPFLALYLSQTLHFTPWQTGTVLTANLLCTRVLPLLSGLLGDRTGHSTLLALGVTVRGLGTLGFALFDTFPALLISAVVLGMGSALHGPSINAILAAQPEAVRVRAFTFYNQAINLGVVAGPALGTLLLTRDPTWPFALGSALLIALGVGLWTRRGHYTTALTSPPPLASLGKVLQDRAFLMFGGVMVVFFLLLTQLSVALPRRAFVVGGSEVAAGWAFLTNGIAGIVLMFALRRFFERRAPLELVRAGLLLIGLGLALVPVAPGVTWLLLCVAIYTLGETLALPGSQLQVAQAAPPTQSGVYFGAFQVFWAIGGTLGNYAGTRLDVAGAVWPWLGFGLLAVLAAWMVTPLMVSRHSAVQGPPAGEPGD